MGSSTGRLCEITTNAKIALSTTPPLPTRNFSPTLASMPVMDPQAAVEQTPPTTETVPAGGEQPQRQPLNVEQEIENLTDAAEIGSLLWGASLDETNADPPAPAPADPEPAGTDVGEETVQDETYSTTDDAGEQPQDPATDEDDAPAEPQAQSASLERISLKSLHPDDRVLIAKAKDLVREGKAAGIAEAVAALTQSEEPRQQEPEPTAEAQAPAPPAPPKTVEQDPQVAEITTRLADLRAQRKAAVEEFDRPTELELTAQIEDALAELSDAKAQAALLSRETTIQNQTLQSVIEDIYVVHPDSEDPKSYFSYRMTQEVADYEQAHGPIRQHPAQLKALAAKVAKELGQAKPAPQAQKPAAAPPPRQNARPLGTSAPGSAATPRTSPNEIQRLTQAATEDDLRAALFGT